MSEARTSVGPSDKYRPDIQGLRGVAVLLVVAYHADTFLTGGFVGVDVFFVLSGYVITRLLVDEFSAVGRLRFGRFYLRRIRRLLPALSFMLVVTLILSIALTSVKAQQITARTGAAAALLNANTYLARFGSGGYFGTRAEANPLLHTWSLSVEEQFYLVFPALLAAAWGLGRRRNADSTWAIGGMLGLILLISLPVSVAFTNGVLDPSGRGPRLAFYSAPTRAWEFAAGGLLVLWVRRSSGVVARSSAEFFAFLGVALVVVAALGFDDRTAFPGTAALAPVVGTASLVWAGAHRRDVSVTRALGWKPLEILGDVSYSWYLWHWPLIVFAAGLWPTTPMIKLAAGLASLLPAWLSYKFVENPIRYRTSPIRSRTVALGLAGTMAVLVAALALNTGNGVLKEADALRPFALHVDVQLGCDSRDRLGERPAACRWSVPEPVGVAVLIGDSNAGQFTEGFVAAASEADMDAVVATSSACPLVELELVDLERRNDRSGCLEFVSGSIEDLLADPPDILVVAAASDFYIQQERWQLGSLDGNEKYDTPTEKAAAWQEALGQTLAPLTRAGIRVTVVPPVPKLPPSWKPIDMSPVRQRSVPNVSIDREEALAQRRRALLADVGAAGDTAAVVDFFDDLCPGERCAARDGADWLYRDNGHISIAASEMLADRFTELVFTPALDAKS